MIILLMLLGILTVSCYDDCPRVYSKNITEYNYKPHDTTPAGYRIDLNNQEVNLEDIDCIIEATTNCFAEIPEFEPPDPACLKIVIVPDWFHPIDKNTGDTLETIQIFSCDLPKAQGCAGAIQNNQIIIVPPSLAALSHELTHVQTGKNDPFPEDWKICSDSIRKENCKWSNK